MRSPVRHDPGQVRNDLDLQVVLVSPPLTECVSGLRWPSRAVRSVASGDTDNVPGLDTRHVQQVG